MSQRLSDDCNVVTLQMFAGGEHFAITIPYGPAVHVDPVQASEDMIDFIENSLIPAMQDVLAADAEVIGYSVEGMWQGGVIPVHVNVPLGTWVGTVGGASAPPNVSMLVSFYASDQATSGSRVRVAKNFLGPPPLSKVTNQTLDAVFVGGPMAAVAALISGPFTGVSSGVRWDRMLSRVDASGVMIYIVTSWIVRGTVFTQRRRLLPIL